MNLIVAAVGALSALVFLIFYHRRFTGLRYIIAAYISVSLIAGGAYYFIWFFYPNSFAFADEVLKSAEKEVTKNSNNVSQTMDDIHIVDVFILDVLRQNQFVGKSYHFSLMSDTLQLDNLSKVIAARWHISRIREKEPQGGYNMKSILSLKLKSRSDTMGISNLSSYSFVLKSTLDLNEFEYSGGEILAALKQQRALLLKDLEDNYVPNQVQIRPFTILDFYYFSFTVVGAADIVALNTIIRMMIIFQILILLYFAESKDQVAEPVDEANT